MLEMDSLFIQLSTSIMSNLKRIQGKSRKSLRKLVQSQRLQVNIPLSNVFDSGEIKEAEVEGEPSLALVASLHMDAVQILSEVGMSSYFTLCNKQDREARRIMSRQAEFIVWTYYSKNAVNIEATKDEIMKWYILLLNLHYSCLLGFSNHLQQNKLLSPNTVKNYVSDIVYGFMWLTLFAPEAYRQPMSQMEGIKKVAEQVRSSQSSVNRSLRSDITLEEKIEQRLLPVGGLPELQRAVLDAMPWARAVSRHHIDEASYRRFVSILVAAIYVFSVNGRQSGVMDIKWGQAEELLQMAFCTSKRFKTNKKYGLQPITLAKESHELLAIYVQIVRPQVSRTHPPQAAEDLWLTYKGKSEMQLGKLLTAFFVKSLGLRVTITAIRSLVETLMHKKMQQGLITQEQRNAVMNINGHSSATTEAYYVMEDRTDDVYNARSAFDAAVEESITEQADAFYDEGGDDMDNDVATPSAPSSILLPTAPHAMSPRSPFDPRNRFAAPVRVFAAADWGREHPDYESAKKKAVWTAEEKTYVGMWCTNFIAQHPGATAVVAKCLHYMKTDPAALRIFHKHHTLNSARLRHGYEEFLRGK